MCMIKFMAYSAEIDSAVPVRGSINGVKRSDIKSCNKALERERQGLYFYALPIKEPEPVPFYSIRIAFYKIVHKSSFYTNTNTGTTF